MCANTSIALYREVLNKIWAECVPGYSSERKRPDINKPEKRTYLSINRVPGKTQETAEISENMHRKEESPLRDIRAQFIYFLWKKRDSPERASFNTRPRATGLGVGPEKRSCADNVLLENRLAPFPDNLWALRISRIWVGECVCVFAMLEKRDCHIDCPLCVKARRRKIRKKATWKIVPASRNGFGFCKAFAILALKKVWV